MPRGTKGHLGLPSKVSMVRVDPLPCVPDLARIYAAYYGILYFKHYLCTRYRYSNTSYKHRHSHSIWHLTETFCTFTCCSSSMTCSSWWLTTFTEGHEGHWLLILEVEIITRSHGKQSWKKSRVLVAVPGLGGLPAWLRVQNSLQWGRKGFKCRRWRPCVQAQHTSTSSRVNSGGWKEWSAAPAGSQGEAPQKGTREEEEEGPWFFHMETGAESKLCFPGWWFHGDVTWNSLRLGPGGAGQLPPGNLGWGGSGGCQAEGSLEGLQAR